MNGRSLTLTERLIAREVAFVAMVLLVLSLPWLTDVAAVSWIAIGAILAFALVNPLALVLSVPAAIGVSFKPFELGAMQLNVLEVLIAATAAGYLPRALVAGWRNLDDIRARPGEFSASVAPDRMATGIALLLLLAGTISLFTLADADYARESLRFFRWTVFFPVAYFLIASVVVRSETTRHLAAALFLAGAVLSALIAVVDGIAGGGVQADSVLRLTGLAPHPNALALVLDRAAIFGILMALLYRPAVSRWWGLGAAIVTLATVLTFSRGALLALVTGCLLILLLSRARRVAFVAGAVAVVGLGLLLAIAPDRTLSLLGGGSGSLRLELWRSSLHMIRDYPVTGVGLDQFLYQYLPRYVSPEAWGERFTSHPHNLLLDAWLSLGIIGALIVALIAFLWIRHVRAALRTHDRISLAAAGALAGLVVHGMVDQSYFLPELAVSTWVLILLLRPACEVPPIPTDTIREPEG